MYEFYCGIDEFWSSFQKAILDLELYPFKQHQITKQVIALTLEEARLPLEWQWDLWVAKICPPDGFWADVPAKSSWIQVSPPIELPGKILTEAYIGARTEWSEHGETWINEELRETYSKFRRGMAKGTIVGKSAISFPNGVTRAFSVRYTSEAAKLQADGWCFKVRYTQQVITIPN